MLQRCMRIQLIHGGCVAVAACLALVMLSGCRTLTEEERTLKEAESIVKRLAREEADKRLTAADVIAPPEVAKAKLLEDSPIIVDQIAPEDIEGVDKKVVFPERKVPDLPKAKIGEYPDNLIKGIKDPDEVLPVVLNLDATSLTEVVPLFGALLNFSYLIDPGAKGAVTLAVDTEMTAREAWELFEHILWLSGAYASKNPGFIHILPFAKMSKERRLLFNFEPLANVEVAFIPIYHVKSAEIITNIKPFMTDGATVTDLLNSNTLLIVEAPANMPKLRELISRLDNKGEASWPHTFIKVEEVDAEELVTELEQLLPVLGFPVTSKGPSGGQIKLTSIPRLQTIVVSAALSEVLDEVEQLARVLDQGDSSTKENIFFYNVKNGTAAELNDALGVFFNASSTTGTRTSKTKSTSSKATATAGSKTTKRTPSRSSSTRSQSATAEGEGESIFDTPVIVYVDETQNRLTIRTTQRTYALVEALLERHDVPPRQVSIQAIIADITLNKDTEFGFAYAAQHSDKFQYGVDNMDAGSPWVDAKGSWPDTVKGVANSVPGAAVLAKSGIAAGWINGDRMAFITAIAGETNTRVLSAPQVIVLSDEEAIINVGERVPIPTESTNYTGDNFSTNWQYEDTGVIMTVTPRVTAGNNVRLEIKQEVSDAKAQAGANDPPPRITNKVLETVMTIPDGATVMMGGLIKTDNTDSHDGVPYLKDVPYIGRLFRTNRTVRDRSELLILITVNVVDTESGMDRLVERYQQALKALKEVKGEFIPE